MGACVSGVGCPVSTDPSSKAGRYLLGNGWMLPHQFCLQICYKLNGKDVEAGKNWKEKEKGAAEDGMVLQHHGLNEYEFEQTLGGSGGQRSLSMERKELDTT